MTKGGPRPGKRIPRSEQRTPRPGKGAPRRRQDDPRPESAAPRRGVFRLGAIPGATPGKWIATWRERTPGVELELHSIPVAAQTAALHEATVDAALVRLPIDDAALHVIRLYEEVPVVVMPADSDLTAADELVVADLAGEVVIVPDDDVLSLDVPGAVAPAFGAPLDTGQAVATVAAGVGVVVVPMSLARLHHRKDVAYRPLRDGPVSPVALAWPRASADPHVETFIGIVRGRTANSSR